MGISTTLVGDVANMMSISPGLDIKFSVDSTGPRPPGKGEALGPALEKAARAFDKFNRSLKRPRRSRQCRGKRARNYVRTLARSGRNLDIEDRGPAAKRVLAEARSTGALAEHRRLTTDRADAARKRGREA